LAEEVKELHADKKALVEQKVKLVIEGKKEIEETKKKFVENAARLVEGNVNQLLKRELEQYRNDIKSARENDFGRRIFEAFAGEYMASYLNEGTVAKKLQKEISSLKT